MADGKPAGRGKRGFGTIDGNEIFLYTLVNGTGMEMAVSNYGGIVVSLRAPDRNGRLDDVTLGCRDLENYKKNSAYFGAIVGRCCNRIGNARFSLEGREYMLAANNGPNCLHGGIKGFDKVVWNVRELRHEKATGLELSYLSNDGEEGFPGNLKATVAYWLTEENEFKIEYAAVTDKTTVVNLTNHAYWNLAGEGSGDILGHVVTINADYYTPVNSSLIPTGAVLPVKGTPMDFNRPFGVGDRIDTDFEQLRFGGGYDHNWVINRPAQGKMVRAATLHEPESGRFLEIFTTEPGVQLYTGNFLEDSMIGKSGRAYGRRHGLCFETQHFPDSPNKPQFPSVVLRQGETFRSRTTFRFSVKE